MKPDQFVNFVNKPADLTLSAVNEFLKSKDFPEISKNEVDITKPGWISQLFVVLYTLYKKEQNSYRHRHYRNKTEERQQDISFIRELGFAIGKNSVTVFESKAKLKLAGYTMSSYKIAEALPISRATVDGLIREIREESPNDVAYYLCASYIVEFVKEEQYSKMRERVLKNSIKENSGTLSILLTIDKSVLLEMIEKNEPIQVKLPSPVVTNVLTDKEKQIAFLKKRIEDLDFSIRLFDCVKSNSLEYAWQIIEFIKSGKKFPRDYGKKSEQELYTYFNNVGIDIDNISYGLLNAAKI